MVAGKVYQGPLIARHQRVGGLERDQLARSLRSKYERGASIRELADQIGRSYGFVHRVLLEADVELRGRGGPRTPKPVRGGHVQGKP